GQVLGAEADEPVLHQSPEAIPETDEVHAVCAGRRLADGANGGIESGGVAAGGQDPDGARHRTGIVTAFASRLRQAATGVSVEQTGSGPLHTIVYSIPASSRAASAASRGRLGMDVTFMPRN